MYTKCIVLLLFLSLIYSVHPRHISALKSMDFEKVDSDIIVDLVQYISEMKPVQVFLIWPHSLFAENVYKIDDFIFRLELFLFSFRVGKTSRKWLTAFKEPVSFDRVILQTVKYFSRSTYFENVFH